MTDFKLTYATMFDPPAELHTGFDKAIAKQKANLGREYGMLIDGRIILSDEKMEDYSPIDVGMKLAIMQKGDETHAQAAIEAARDAFPTWSRTPWQERIKLLMVGGVSQRGSNILEGSPQDVADRLAEYLASQNLIPVRQK